MLRRITKVNPAEINRDVSMIKRIAKELEQAVEQYSSRMGRASRDTADFFTSSFGQNLKSLINRIASDVIYEHAKCMPPNLHTDPDSLLFDMNQLAGTDNFDADFLEDRAVWAYLNADERSFHELLGACQRMVPLTTSGGKGILKGRALRLFMREYDDFNTSAAVVSKLSKVLACGEQPAYVQEGIRVPPPEWTDKSHIGVIKFQPEEPIAYIKRFKNGLFLVEYNSEAQARAMARLLSATEKEADALWQNSRTKKHLRKTMQV